MEFVSSFDGLSPVATETELHLEPLLASVVF